MKGKGIIITLVLVSAGILVLLFMLDSQESAGKSKNSSPGKIERKKNNWEKRYGHNNIDPYGTFIFYQLLKAENRKKVKVLKRSTQYEWMDTIKHPGKLYMYIGTGFPDNRFHLKRVLSMVKHGNAAFISAEVFPERIIRMLNRTHNLYMNCDLSVTSYFEHLSFEDTVGVRFNYIYKNRKINHYWTYFYPHRPLVMRICVPGENDTVVKTVWVAEGKYITPGNESEYDEEEEYETGEEIRKPRIFPIL